MTEFHVAAVVSSHALCTLALSWHINTTEQLLMLLTAFWTTTGQTLTNKKVFCIKKCSKLSFYNHIRQFFENQTLWT